jgi:hypothetical protein
MVVVPDELKDWEIGTWGGEDYWVVADALVKRRRLGKQKVLSSSLLRGYTLTFGRLFPRASIAFLGHVVNSWINSRASFARALKQCEAYARQCFPSRFILHFRCSLC